MFFSIKALVALCIRLEAIYAEDIIDHCSSAAPAAQGRRLPSCLIQQNQLKRSQEINPGDHQEAPVSAKVADTKEKDTAKSVDKQVLTENSPKADTEVKKEAPAKSEEKAKKEEKTEPEGEPPEKKSEKSEDEVEKKDQKADDKPNKKDLPDDLHKLAEELLGGGSQVDKFISETEFVDATVFKVKMSLRIKKGDNAVARLPEEGRTDEYGIDSLLNSPTPHGMINVVDMGANLGAVSIALFKKYPKYIRAAIAEPTPMTYLLLRWNLWSNGVPALTEQEIAKKGSDRKPGVFAINKGVSETGKDMHFCYAKENSMNAAICNCSQPPFPSECLTVQTIKTKKMIGYFGEDGIDLLKMDCEGCELDALPALTSNSSDVKNIRRLVGELHEVPPEIEDMACKFNHKTWMTKVCSHPIGAGKQLECNPETRNKECYKPVPWQRASQTV